MDDKLKKKIIYELIKTFINAGDIALELRDKGLKKIIKDDNTPVTNGDLEVNKIITNKLKEITPEIPIVSEEVSDNKDSNNLSTFWLIDPIDGTYDYLNNKEEFTLNAGLIINKKPDIAIINAPAKKRLFYTFGINNSFELKDNIEKKLDSGINSKNKELSALVYSDNIKDEISRIKPQLELFKSTGASVIVYGETYRTVQNKIGIPLNRRPKLDQFDIKDYGKKLSQLAEFCEDKGVPLTFHHHMGTAVETEEEISKIMLTTSKEVGLLLDTGHLYFAEGNYKNLISKFGKQWNSRLKTTTDNPGIDIKGQPGSPIRSTMSGVVTTITYIRGYGTTVIIDHGGGFYTVYSHVTNIQTQVDSEVRSGDVIAYMGDSGSVNGSKLHFEVWGKGQKLDPEKWLIKK